MKTLPTLVFAAAGLGACVLVVSKYKPVGEVPTPPVPPVSAVVSREPVSETHSPLPKEKEKGEAAPAAAATPIQLLNLTKALGLTDEQKGQTGKILSNSGVLRQSLLKDRSMTKAERNAQVIALRDDTKGKIRALLTPDQQKIFDAPDFSIILRNPDAPR